MKGGIKRLEKKMLIAAAATVICAGAFSFGHFRQQKIYDDYAQNLPSKPKAPAAVFIERQEPKTEANFEKLNSAQKSQIEIADTVLTKAQLEKEEAAVLATRIFPDSVSGEVMQRITQPHTNIIYVDKKGDTLCNVRVPYDSSGVFSPDQKYSGWQIYGIHGACSYSYGYAGDSLVNAVKNILFNMDHVPCSIPPYKTWAEFTMSHIHTFVLDESQPSRYLVSYPFRSNPNIMVSNPLAWESSSLWKPGADSIYDKMGIDIDNARKPTDDEGMVQMIHEAGHNWSSSVGILDKGSTPASDVACERQAVHIVLQFLQDYKSDVGSYIEFLPDTARFKQWQLSYTFSYEVVRRKDSAQSAEQEKANAFNQRLLARQETIDDSLIALQEKLEINYQQALNAWDKKCDEAYEKGKSDSISWAWATAPGLFGSPISIGFLISYIVSGIRLSRKEEKEKKADSQP